MEELEFKQEEIDNVKYVFRAWKDGEFEEWKKRFFESQ